MITEGEAAVQIAKLLHTYGVELEEVSCSTAVFILSINGGTSTSTRVAKWFHPGDGERYFTFNVADGVKEYFTLALFEEESQVQVVSLGVLNVCGQCVGVFTLKEEQPDAYPLISSDVGYVIEVACVESGTAVDLADFSVAKHIESKYLQRRRNVAHYYPPKTSPQVGDFLVLVQDDQSKTDSTCPQTYEHPWNLEAPSDGDLSRGYKEYQKGATHVHLSDNLYLAVQRPLTRTNVWGVLLYDVAAQSLTSASIPKTHLYVPWVIWHDNCQELTLKIVV